MKKILKLIIVLYIFTGCSQDLSESKMSSDDPNVYTTATSETKETIKAEISEVKAETELNNAINSLEDVEKVKTMTTDEIKQKIQQLEASIKTRFVTIGDSLTSSLTENSGYKLFKGLSKTRRCRKKFGRRNQNNRRNIEIMVGPIL